ncbi:MAG TPA: FAD-dependent oxidoreductase [Mucilaginibacter sp.]
MIKRLLLFLLIFEYSALRAQTIKTDVVVIGGTPSGMAAAIQSSRSRLKTVLVINGYSLKDNLPAGDAEITTNSNLSSGIWGEFRHCVRQTQSKGTGADTSWNAPLKLNIDTGIAILNRISDTVKNLTVNADAKFSQIKKDGDRWEVMFSDGKNTLEIKAKVVIDATADGGIALKAGGKLRYPFYGKTDGGNNIYRTSIAAAESLPTDMFAPSAGNYPQYPAYFVPLYAVVANNLDNVLVTEMAIPGKRDIQYLPFQLQLGQGVGATAAYLAFFKTTTQHLNVRIIQGEILDFKGYLLPIADIKQTDVEWRAVQQVSASGLLRGKEINNKFLFMPDSTVNTAEIKPVLTEIYTRAFLWFNKEKPGDKFTVGNTLSFISDYTLTDPLILNRSMQKAWKGVYKFQSDFDVNRPITRLEFAVLANKFLNPFARTVDLSGRLVN